MTKVPKLHFAVDDNEVAICGAKKGICTSDKKVFNDYLSPCQKCEQILNKKEMATNLSTGKEVSFDGMSALIGRRGLI